MYDFDGRSALVTGGSGGIGAETARKLAAAGAKVGVGFRSNADDANRLVEEIKSSGGEALAIGGDASDPGEAKIIADKMASAFGTIDILVNAAGTLQNLPFGDISAESFHEQFSANTLSVVLMMQEAAKHFSPDGARVVNISTNLAYGPLPGTAIYCAAKAAVITLTQGFANELGGRNIAVNSVAAGATNTQMTAWLDDETRTAIAENTPLGRIAEADDIADVILFLASPAARWITGRTIIADGGLI